MSSKKAINAAGKVAPSRKEDREGLAARASRLRAAGPHERPDRKAKAKACRGPRTARNWEEG